MMTEEELSQLDIILNAVRLEVIAARTKHVPMGSPHEGYAVILEEVDELWNEVKADTGRHHSAEREAIQIAAMGVRYIMDIIENH